VSADDQRSAGGTTLVLLPGLDGTDVFLRLLVAALSRTIRSIVVTYPASGAEKYGDAFAVVRRATEGLSEFYVLGLSFSGPLAVMLAAEEPKRVKGVILAATFVRAPHPGLRFFRFACHGPTLWMWRIARRIPIWALRARRDPLRMARAETLRRVPARCFAGRFSRPSCGAAGLAGDFAMVADRASLAPEPDERSRLARGSFAT